LRRGVQRSRNFCCGLFLGGLRSALQDAHTIHSLLGVPSRSNGGCIRPGARRADLEPALSHSGYYDDFLPLKGLKSPRRKVTECLSYAEVHLRQMAQFGVEWKKQAVPGSIGELVRHVANKNPAGCVTSTECLHARTSMSCERYLLICDRVGSCNQLCH